MIQAAEFVFTRIISSNPSLHTTFAGLVPLSICSLGDGIKFTPYDNPAEPDSNDAVKMIARTKFIDFFMIPALKHLIDPQNKNYSQIVALNLSRYLKKTIH